MRSLLLILPLLGVVHSLDIVSPPSLAVTDLKAVFFNVYFGALPFAPITNVPLSHMPYEEADHMVSGAANCTKYAGTVAVVDSGRHTWRLTHEYRLVEELGRCGAVAVIRFRTYSHMGPRRPSLGMHQRVYETDCCRDKPDLPIPSLDIWFKDIQSAVTELKGGNEVRISVSDVQRSGWEPEYRDNDAWNNLFRVLIPMMNAPLIIYAIYGLGLRYSMWRKPRKATRANPKKKAGDRSFYVLCVGLVAEGIASTIRTVYYAMGPNLINDAFTWEAHMFLLNLSMPFMMVSIAVFAIVMRTLGSFEEKETKRTKWIVASAIFLSILAAIFELSAANARATKPDNLAQWEFISTSLSLYFMGTASSMFLYVGRGFLRSLSVKLDANAGTVNRQVARKRRFTKSLMYSAVAKLVVQTSTVVVVLQPHVYYVPTGFAAIMFFYIIGHTASSYFAIDAFTPHNHAGEHRPGLVKHAFTVAREAIRSRRPSESQDLAKSIWAREFTPKVNNAWNPVANTQPEIDVGMESSCEVGPGGVREVGEQAV